MATRNSGIEARLTIDTKPFEQGLDKASQKLNQTVARMNSNEGVKLRSHDFTAGGGGQTTTGSTQGGAAKQMYPHLQKTNAELRVHGQMLQVGTQNLNKFGAAAKSNAGAGILQLGYAVDDLQYGIKGVANNIPGLMQSMTGSMKAAGWVGIIVTAGTVLWSFRDKIMNFIFDVSDSTGEKLTKANEEAAESYKKLGESMREAGRAAGETRGEFIAAQTGRETAGRANWQVLRDEDERRAAMKDTIATAKAQKYGGTGTEAAVNDIKAAADMRKAKLRLGDMERINKEDTEHLQKAAEDVRITEKQIALLQKKATARTGSGLSAKEQGELGELEGVLPGMKERHKALSEDTSSRANLESAKLDVLEAENNAKAADIALSLKQAAEEKEEKAEAAKKAMEKFNKAVADNLDRVKKMAEALAEGIKKGEEQSRVRRDLGISEIRNPRRRKRAERAAKMADRTEALVKQGFDPSEAADIADREQRVADKSAGDRTIRRRATGDGATKSGLDAFSFGQRGAGAMLADDNVPSPFQASQERGRAALRRTKADADKVRAGTAKEGGEAAGLLQQMLERLDRLIQATEKTPAQRAQPSRS